MPFYDDCYSSKALFRRGLRKLGPIHYELPDTYTHPTTFSSHGIIIITQFALLTD